MKKYLRNKRKIWLLILFLAVGQSLELSALQVSFDKFSNFSPFARYYVEKFIAQYEFTLESIFNSSLQGFAQSGASLLPQIRKESFFSFGVSGSVSGATLSDQAVGKKEIVTIIDQVLKYSAVVPGDIPVAGNLGFNFSVGFGFLEQFIQQDFLHSLKISGYGFNEHILPKEYQEDLTFESWGVKLQKDWFYPKEKEDAFFQGMRTGLGISYSKFAIKNLDFCQISQTGQTQIEDGNLTFSLDFIHTDLMLESTYLTTEIISLFDFFAFFSVYAGLGLDIPLSVKYNISGWINSKITVSAPVQESQSGSILFSGVEESHQALPKIMAGLNFHIFFVTIPVQFQLAFAKEYLFTLTCGIVVEF